MKSYTDLSQSKKLAEILPIESADMEYLAIKETGALIGIVPFVKDDSEVEDSAYSHIYDRIACWSLAALVSILPEIQGGKPIIALDDNYITYSHMSDLHAKADNLVDACVAMIEKLYELKLVVIMNNTYKVNEEAVKKIAERVYDNGTTVINRNDLEEMFPALKESEDERIIERIKKAVESYWSDEPLDEILAWLEKQSEQKHADKVEPKFKVGDTIKHLNGNVFHIARIDGTLYISDEGATISFGRENDWELVEQKPAWSEEDEQYKSGLIGLVENSKAGLPINLRGKAADKCIYWLKSLKDRYTWKPSDIQLECFSDAIKHYNSLGYPASKLQELLDDLKKLKEE